ncbi:sugar ABC transporter ATP-binding protein [Nakamurella aerolata]|uniref:Sugar ABC transporter ATP-binding protein n=1 Tax=Nakamurella aerolata TaxID=1656892 RepID=A0A849A432_9ACTN|nr:sugar ABC transporter ATP-binding protein [Nakamurella aerolata]NNG35774.1 sugar ABC transporter ATP-binding protein [Nakamurella aerolata]
MTAARPHDQPTGPTAGRPPLLRMREIGKSFPGVQALQGVSLTVHPGEVVALLGENGAGKSTLINVLSGVFPHYDGSIEIDGKPVQLHSPVAAQRLGIGTIHQELNLVQDMTIADNIWLGRERGSAGVVDRGSTEASARALLERVGLTLPPRRLVRQCRVAEQQLIEVAKALSLDSRLLIMDEPTSALADAEVQRLFQVIRRLTAEDVAIVYISHRLEELEEIADSVNVLRDGRWIGAKPMAGTSREELVRMMVGRDVADLPRRSKAAEPNLAGSAADLPRRSKAAESGVAEPALAQQIQRPASDRQPRLSVRGLRVQPDPKSGRVSLHGIDLDVHPGEIVGLAGLMGAGRTETLESIFGAYPARVVDGEFTVDGQPYRPSTSRRAIDRGIVLVAEDRKLQSLVLGGSVKFNASLASLSRFVRGGWIRGRAERDAVSAEVKTLGVKARSINTVIGTLSGGNQQKVVLAKCLLTDPGVILLDEPTRGIDIGAKSEIYELVGSLADSGAGVLVASSELPELLRMCDRILVLCEGRMTAEFDADTATQEQLLDAAMARRSLVDAGGSGR